MRVPLCCPRCSSPLEDLTDFVQCLRCNRKWEVSGGIPRFFDQPYYWGEISQNSMRDVNRIAKERSWMEACETIIKPSKPKLHKYITSHGRADFMYLTPATSESVVLDIGSGWGAISCTLATRYRHVVSIESVSERIEFLKIRAEQDGLTNIQPVQASFLELPLPESAFDLIVLNGVVEWIGVARDDEAPDALQKQVLSKLKKCLKPGGGIYIGIENRLGYRYFLGAKDHTGLPFTSLMPRPLADVVMRKSTQSYRTSHGRKMYRTYSYSYWGYRSLLRGLGFSKVNMFAVFPDYNDPSYIVPLETTSPFRYVLNHMYSGDTMQRKMLRRLMILGIPFSLHRLLSPCFSIFAYL